MSKIVNTLKEVQTGMDVKIKTWIKLFWGGQTYILIRLLFFVGLIFILLTPDSHIVFLQFT